MRDADPSERRYARMSRRAAVTGAALLTLALGACGDKVSKPAEGDMALGAPEGAKVTVVEYASVTCSHCATWQATVWPAFKAKYVDTNRVRYVFRELPTSPVEVATAGFLVARCAGQDKYFGVVEELMARQNEIFTTTPRAVLLDVAAKAGLSEAQFTTCLSDTAAIERMDARVKAAVAADVEGTPAFFVNGEKVVDSSLAGLSGKIDAALGAN